MTIEKIDQSIYFHSWINNTNSSVLNALSSLINQNECIIFYRPRASILKTTEEKVSSETSVNKEKIVLSEGGIESNITQVVVFQAKHEKHLIPFYCSRDQTCFSLFYGKEVFKDLSALFQWTAHTFCRKKNAEKSYQLINLTEKEPSFKTESLTHEKLDEILEHINAYTLLNNKEVRKNFFPTKYLKKHTEEIVFDNILTIAPVNDLNLYVIKTAKIFALIAEDELLALSRFQCKTRNPMTNQKENMPTETKSSNLEGKQVECAGLTSNTAIPTPFFFNQSKSETTKKRKHDEIVDKSTEENTSKCLKTMENS